MLCDKLTKLQDMNYFLHLAQKPEKIITSHVGEKTHFEQLRALCTRRGQLNVICTAIKVLFNKKKLLPFYDCTLLN